jgi:hypothetical protein
MVRLLQLERNAYTAFEHPEAAIVTRCNRIAADSFTQVVQVETAFQIQNTAKPA